MKENPNYMAFIPATLRYDNRLKASEKILFGEFTALANKKGYCFATNKYFSTLYGVSVVTVSRWINHLKELGYIHVEMIKEGKEIKERQIYPLLDPLSKKLTPLNKNDKRGINKNDKGGINKNVKENNTSINNTSINNKRNIKESQASLTDRFETLWKQYPRKQGKKAALQAYKRAIKKGVTDKEIELGIANYKKYIKVSNTKPQYIQMGSTWFNGEGWQNEYSYGNQPKQQEEKEWLF